MTSNLSEGSCYFKPNIKGSCDFKPLWRQLLLQANIEGSCYNFKPLQRQLLFQTMNQNPEEKTPTSPCQAQQEKMLHSSLFIYINVMH